MILMSILAIVGEDEIGRCLLQTFECFFHLGAYVRQKTVVKTVTDCRASGEGGTGKQQRGTLGFFAANPLRTEDEPIKYAAGMLRGHLQDGASATDLNIVGMRADAQNAEERFFTVGYEQVLHESLFADEMNFGNGWS